MNQIVDIGPFEEMTPGRFAKMIWTWPFQDMRSFWRLMGTYLLWLLAAVAAAVVAAILFSAGSEETAGEMAGYTAAIVLVLAVVYLISIWTRILLNQTGNPEIAPKPGLGDLIRFVFIFLMVFLVAAVVQSPLALLSYSLHGEGELLEYLTGFDDATGDPLNLLLYLGRYWLGTIVGVSFLIHLVHGAAGIYDEITPTMKLRLRQKTVRVTNYLFGAFLPLAIFSYAFDLLPEDGTLVLVLSIPFMILSAALTASGLALPYCALGLDCRRQLQQE